MNLKKILCLLCSAAACFSLMACAELGVPPGGDNPKDPSGPSTEFPDEQIPDDNEVDENEPDTTKHDFALVSDVDGTLTYKCSDCDEEKTVVISYDSGTRNAYTVDGNTITFRNITEKSVYGIFGSLYGNIVVDVTDDYKFELELRGFEVYSYTECPIVIESGDKVTLSAKKSTDNFIYDMREAIDGDDDAIKASVYAKCDLNIQGKGTLNVKSVNNNGIHTKDDLDVKNLALQVDCKDNALKGDDSVTIESGDIVLIARQGDGIKTKNSDVSSKGNQRGTIAITGGNVLIYAACDGLDASYDVTVDESSSDVNLQIYTDKYSKFSEEVTAVTESIYYVRNNSTSYKYSLKFYNTEADAIWYNSSSYKSVGNYCYYPITKPSGYSYVQLYIYNGSQQQGQSENYVACSEGMTVNNNYDTIALSSRGNTMSFSWTNYTTSSQGGFGPGGGPGGQGGPGGWGMNDGNTDKGDHSTKGIKANNIITVSGGTITVSAYDDAIHANNDNALENGATPLGNVIISGGTLTLRSNDDGIHGDGTVVINGGTVTVVSSYEGIEGTTVELSGGTVSVVSSDDGINGTATSGTAITVSDGYLYVYAGGDGVDSNSKTSYEGIVFSGGRSVIISTGQSDSSIDTEQGYKFTGGYVVGIGRSGGMGNEATKCSNFSSVGTSKTLSLSGESYLVVGDVAAVRVPTSLNALVVVLGKTNASITSSTSVDYELDGNGVYWNV
ncbi:MAG: carbohydrate-binding domain-containing protein [Clostridiales bacterium]|nr:carbohydrate-binding domain-containing protein [Clostridiales bacterium]